MSTSKLEYPIFVDYLPRWIYARAITRARGKHRDGCVCGGRW